MNLISLYLWNIYFYSVHVKACLFVPEPPKESKLRNPIVFIGVHGIHYLSPLWLQMDSIIGQPLRSLKWLIVWQVQVNWCFQSRVLDQAYFAAWWDEFCGLIFLMVVFFFFYNSSIHIPVPFVYNVTCTWAHKNRKHKTHSNFSSVGSLYSFYFLFFFNLKLSHGLIRWKSMNGHYTEPFIISIRFMVFSKIAFRLSLWIQRVNLLYIFLKCIRLSLSMKNFIFGQNWIAFWK